MCGVEMGIEEKTTSRLLMRALARVGLVVASLLLVLGMAEVIARVTWPEVQHRPLEAPASGLQELSGRETARANARGLINGVFYRTNAAALRGPDYEASPAPGTSRIAIAGDSVTVGTGVDEEDTYSAVLERLLEAQPEGEQFEVINMGRGGLNARWVINRMVRASRFYRFQLVVYGWTPNDIEGKHYQELVGRDNWMAHWETVARYQNHPSYLVRSLWPRFMWMRSSALPKNASRVPELRWNYFENPKAWADFTGALDTLADFTRQRGICGHVYIHSRDEELLDVHDRVANAARMRGLTVSRSMPAFEGREKSDFWLSPFDAHANVEGHELLAQALFDGLKEELPAHCWETRVDAASWPTLSGP